MSDNADNDANDRFHVCATCGRLKHSDLFEMGDCTCKDCYSEGRSGVNWHEADDGDGYIRQGEDSE